MPQSYASCSNDPLKKTAKTLCFQWFYAAYGTSESYAEATNAIIMQKLCRSTRDLILNNISEKISVEVLQNAPTIFCNFFGIKTLFCHFSFFSIYCCCLRFFLQLMADQRFN